MRSTAAVCILYLFTLTGVNAASFDCSKAESINEIAICANHSLSRLDEQYSELYADARKAGPDPDAIRRIAVQEFAKRESTCTDNACLRSWYVRRIVELQITGARSEAGSDSQPVLTVSQLYDRFNYRSIGSPLALRQCHRYISQRPEFDGVHFLSPAELEAIDGNIGLADRLKVLGPNRISVQRYGLGMAPRHIADPVEFDVVYDPIRREWRVAGTSYDELPDFCTSENQ